MRPSLENEDLVFVDIEVFKFDSFIVLKNHKKERIGFFHNTFVGLLDYIKGKSTITYNGYHYDDHILTAMINQWTPHQIKELNDRIINGEKIKNIHKDIVSLDCFQEIDVSRPSLKKIEANSGKMIKETSVDFTIDRKLTPEELEVSVDYCDYDIDETIDVFFMRKKTYFEPKMQILNMNKSLPEKAYRWNNTTISANVLLSKPLTKWSQIRTPDEMLQMVPEEVVDLWLTKEKGSITTQEFDNDIQWGFGGIHSQHRTRKHFKNVHNLDVASLYPSIICNYDILGVATSLYNDIREERIRIKHIDKQRQLALKLVLNSVYGLLKNKYSLLNNPKASTTVCAIGQSLLYDLTKRLAPSCTIVQMNTDGVAFLPLNDDYLTVWKQWEADWGLSLEEDIFTTFIQRDVNNYIAVDPDGEIKTKGGDVNNFAYDAYFKNNNTRIVDIAIVEYLVNGKDVLETLMENVDNPRLYQYVLKAGHTYNGTANQDGNLLNTKVNRVFAGKEKGLTLFKQRPDGGLVRYADAPSDMLLWNDDCSELEDFGDKVDLNFYYQLIKHKLKGWES